MTNHPEISFLEMAFPAGSDGNFHRGQHVFYEQKGQPDFLHQDRKLHSINPEVLYEAGHPGMCPFRLTGAKTALTADRIELHAGPDYRLLLARQQAQQRAFLHLEGKPDEVRVRLNMKEDPATRQMLANIARRPAPRKEKTYLHGQQGCLAFGLDYDSILQSFGNADRRPDGHAPDEKLDLHVLFQDETLALVLQHSVWIDGIIQPFQEYSLIALVPFHKGMS